jgi:hypothetical protein
MAPEQVFERVVTGHRRRRWLSYSFALVSVDLPLEAFEFGLEGVAVVESVGE